MNIENVISLDEIDLVSLFLKGIEELIEREINVGHQSLLTSFVNLIEEQFRCETDVAIH